MPAVKGVERLDSAKDLGLFEAPSISQHKSKLGLLPLLLKLSLLLIPRTSPKLGASDQSAAGNAEVNFFPIGNMFEFANSDSLPSPLGFDIVRLFLCCIIPWSGTFFFKRLRQEPCSFQHWNFKFVILFKWIPQRAIDLLYVKDLMRE